MNDNIRMGENARHFVSRSRGSRGSSCRVVQSCHDSWPSLLLAPKSHRRRAPRAARSPAFRRHELGAHSLRAAEPRPARVPCGQAAHLRCPTPPSGRRTAGRGAPARHCYSLALHLAVVRAAVLRLAPPPAGRPAPLPRACRCRQPHLQRRWRALPSPALLQQRGRRRQDEEDAGRRAHQRDAAAGAQGLCAPGASPALVHA
jgi:hypothetical protein